MNKIVIVGLFLLITILVFKIKKNNSKENFQSVNNCSSVTSQSACYGDCYWDSSPQMCKPKCELITNLNTCSQAANCMINQQGRCIRECTSIIGESSCGGNCTWDNTSSSCQYSSNPLNTSPTVSGGSQFLVGPPATTAPTIYDPSQFLVGPPATTEPTVSDNSQPGPTAVTTPTNMTTPTQSGSTSESNFVLGSGKTCKNLSLINPDVKCTYIQPSGIDDSYINLDRELNSHRQQYAILYKNN